MTDGTAPTRSAAFSADGKFDESRLAKPSDWAALDDFDEEAVLAEMQSRVDETWLAAKQEFAREKKTAALDQPPAAALPAKPVAATKPAAALRPAAPAVSNKPLAAPTAVASASGACAACGERAVKLKRCTACKCVSYCCKSCQQQHWPTHKIECKRLAAEAEAAAAAAAAKDDDLVALD